MRFVEDAKRDQKQASLEVRRIVDAVVDKRLLKLGLTSVAAAHYGMFELEFGIKADAVIEAMAKKQDEAPQIRLIVIHVGIAVLVVSEFTVTAHRSVADGRGRTRTGTRSRRICRLCLLLG